MRRTEMLQEIREIRFEEVIVNHSRLKGSRPIEITKCLTSKKKLSVSTKARKTSSESLHRSSGKCATRLHGAPGDPNRVVSSPARTSHPDMLLVNIESRFAQQLGENPIGACRP